MIRGLSYWMGLKLWGLHDFRYVAIIKVVGVQE